MLSTSARQYCMNISDPLVYCQHSMGGKKQQHHTVNTASKFNIIFKTAKNRQP